jgi:formylglycine-generating enzyme required for sulfatase activity
MMPTAGERLILAACHELTGQGEGFVIDSEISNRSAVTVDFVRDCLRGLDSEQLVDLVPLEDGGLKASVTPKGRQELAKDWKNLEGQPPWADAPKQVKVVPKGLRPFDAEDKDFFLDLLPGPRRSEGLPESINFWKVRIEEMDPDKTFKVGLIHGPSGCGKSSLVKAGLLPKLAPHVRHVYVEATPDDTEVGLLRKLRNEFPELKNIRSSPKFVAALCKGQAVSTGQKVVIVIDQFEQWLHSNPGIRQTELVDALMRCDGGRVQSIMLVRDDFWTATTRFSTLTGVKFDHDSNAYFVDLFHQPHGEHILKVFGQACGRVGDPVTSDQEGFIELAASRLAVNGMILPVRLALFFLLFQGRKWTTQTIKDIGAIENIELELLKKTFDFGYSNPIHRDHRDAAQSILGALLPESGSEIKRQKSWQELLDVSGYSSHPERFAELLRILDKDLFLVTPTDPARELSVDGDHVSEPTKRYYELTHDFLVPSLREWRNKDQEASQLVQAISMAETKDLPQLVEKLDGLRFWADPKLRQIVEYPATGSKERLHASLALLPVDREQFEYLYSRLLVAGPNELPVLREALRSFRERLIGLLWNVLEQSDEKRQYLQAASVMALYDPSNPRWEAVGSRVARAMVTVNAVQLGFWLDIMRPVRDHLVVPLAALIRDRDRSEKERNLASDLLEDFANDRPHVLTDLLMNSTEDHFDLWFGKLGGRREVAVPLLKEEMGKSLPEGTEAEKDRLAERQARAGIALVRLGDANEIWFKLQHSSDPRLRSFLVNWLNPLGADPKLIAVELDRLPVTAKPTPSPGQHFMDAVLFHPETSQRRALILALGAYNTNELGECDSLIGKLLDFYRNDPDAGIHGAADWALRQWKNEENLKGIDAELSKLRDWGERRWFVNSQGQSFAVIEGPVEFLMGSPPTEPDRIDLNETPHWRIIPWRFAIAATLVSVRQFQAFLRETPALQFSYLEQYSPDPDGPQIEVNWYEAAAYCNWLSRQEKLPECYEPNSQGQYAAGMRIKPDALSLGGYRLPTEGEWEYACRAGARTSRCYGASVDLLGQYAWYVDNSEDHAWSCGSLLPNDLGLFDMLGNTFEWGQEVPTLYRPDDRGRVTESKSVRDALVNDNNPRILRGGAFYYPPASVRSANRGRNAPANRNYYFGFRPSRTYN